MAAQASRAPGAIVSWTEPASPVLRLLCLPGDPLRELADRVSADVAVVAFDPPSAVPPAAAAVDALAGETDLPLVIAAAGDGAQAAQAIAAELDRRELPAPVALALADAPSPAPGSPGFAIVGHSSTAAALAGELPRRLERVAEQCRAVQEFVESDVLQGDEKITPATPLLELGIVDSVSMMAIVAFVEQELGIRVPEDDAQPRNVRDVLAIQRMVIRLDQAR